MSVWIQGNQVCSLTEPLTDPTYRVTLRFKNLKLHKK